MLRPRIRANIIAAVIGLVVFSGPAFSAKGQDADIQETLHLVVGRSDTPSRMLAIGLTSLANIKIPAFNIDVPRTGLSDDALVRVTASGVDFGLLDLKSVDLAELEQRSDLRAVMKYWLQKDANRSSSLVNGDYLLVAKTALEAERVRDLVNATLDASHIMRLSGVDETRMTPSMSMVDLPLPLHPGADNYLAAKGIVLRPVLPSTALVAVDDQAATLSDASSGGDVIDAEKTGGKSFTLYFETDEAKLDKTDFVSLAEACQFAATLPSARFVISGHTDTMGPDTYNDWLSKQRAANVAVAIRNDPRFREALSVMEYGERYLAVATDDEVSEPMNRRVEIAVVPGAP